MASTCQACGTLDQGDKITLSLDPMVCRQDSHLRSWIQPLDVNSRQPDGCSSIPGQRLNQDVNALTLKSWKV
jgi:hypothetical protein